MYTMRQVCNQLHITYETLRFYCDEGLVPNVKRDRNNYRQFDERDLSWLQSLLCLKRCGMSVKDMKAYLALCLEGKTSIRPRKQMLCALKQTLLHQIDEIQKSIDFIDGKQRYFDDVLEGKLEYTSNLIDVNHTNGL